MPYKFVGNDTGSFSEGLRGRLADPFWLLHRQYSLLEFHAEDAGTPVGAELSYETRQLPDQPLEPLIEADAVTTGRQTFRVAAEAGQILIRWLHELGRSGEVSALRSSYGLVLPVDVPESELLRARMWVEHGLDGLQLVNDTSTNGDPYMDEIKEVIDDWLNSSFHQVAASNWVPETQSYSGTVQQPNFALTYQGYPGGELDWTDFALLDDTGTGAVLNSSTVPSRVSFPGLPDRRWWAIEDAALDLSDPEIEGWRIAQTVAAEFAVAYADDWFMIPVRVTKGVAVKVQSLTITDSFGQQIVVPWSKVADTDRPQTFGLWELTSGAEWLIVQPPMSDPLQGPVLEQVRFFQDEMANLAWAAEEIVPTPCGGYHKRVASPDTTLSDGTWTWELAQRVPAHWYPLVPPSLGDIVNGVPIQTMVADLPFQLGRQQGQADPLGDVLMSPPVSTVYENHIRGPAVVVERRWQRSRLPDGTAISWLGRERRGSVPAQARDFAWDRVSKS